MPSTEIEELWNKISKLEAEQEALWSGWDWREDYPKLPCDKNATLSKLLTRLHKIEIVEVYFDRLDLDRFRLGTGRINMRAVARELCSQIKLRNERIDTEGVGKPIEKIGQRTMESIVQALIAESEKPK